MTQLTVSKVAEQAGTSTDTLRYYERIGLLVAPQRSASGYRLYDGEALERLLFIKRSQSFGLRLDEIRELLEIRERGLCPCGHTRELLERRVRQLDEEMSAIARLRGDIQRLLEEPAPPEGAWHCRDELLQIRPSRKASRRKKGGET